MSTVKVVKENRGQITIYNHHSECPVIAEHKRRINQKLSPFLKLKKPKQVDSKEHAKRLLFGKR